MKRIAKILVLVILISTISCGKKSTEVADNREVIPVKVATPSSESESYITASGKIEAVQNANLSTRMMGYVTNVYAKVGDKVSKGQLLISINSADINAQKAQVNASIAEATAAFNNAEKDYNRFKALFEANSASQKEMDDITAHYQMAKARLEAANQMKNQVNAQLSYSNITAPFSGVITGKYINNGDMANPGMPLLSIENASKFQVVAMVPESEISKINSNSKAKVIIKSTNKIVNATVTEVSSSATNTGGQYLVKVVLDDNNKEVLSGMFVNVQFESIGSDTNKNSAQILIPQNALITQGQLKGIYTISSENTAILRWLRVGKTYGEKIEVLSGLKADENYIISAEGKLYNGAKVAIQ
jgi:RND family efflux transporter MFP subunit